MNNIKRILNISMILSIILFSFVSSLFPAQAQAETISLSYKEGIEQIVKENDVEVSVSSSSEREAVRVKESITAGLDRISLLQKLETDGFYEVNNSGDGNFEPIKIKDMHSRATDYLMLIEYQNADGEPLLVQVLYNSDTDSLISVYAEKLDTRESKLEPYMDYSEYKESEIQTYDFTWNGKSFQCSVAGLVVCFSYCLGWNIVGPVAGGVCDIACGLAFAAMCAAA